jgi:PIN domain nuclease of toxin-antitoxin system
VKSVLLDTHSWAWSLIGDPRLSAPARNSIEAADAVLVSPISFVEIGQKVCIGKRPEMEPLVDRLAEILEEQGGIAATLDQHICLAAAIMPWPHHDPIFGGLVSRFW